MQPLVESHPELSVFDQPGFREYRVENQNVITGFTWKLAAITVIIGLLWDKVPIVPL